MKRSGLLNKLVETLNKYDEEFAKPEVLAEAISTYFENRTMNFLKEQGSGCRLIKKQENEND